MMGLFMQADGLKYVMEQRCLERSLADQFPPSKSDLITNYQYIENLLNKDYHAFVGLGASIAGDGVLTDHGEKHIESVMNKAWNIVRDKIEQLNGYEIYLLLLSIHFHDLGNISGREAHEQKIIDIMGALGEKLPLDDAEQEFVAEIAMAHGGHVRNNKNDINTLRTLERKTTCNGIPIRPMLLAAILRLADELADDYDRIIPSVTIPPENKAFQEYSKSLEPIGFNGKSLNFRFRLPYGTTKKKMKMLDKNYYLYDVILKRLTKCLCELDYCKRYSDGFIDFEEIHVNMQVRDPKNSCKVLARDSFKLSLSGYPREEAYNLADLIVIDHTHMIDSSYGITKSPQYSNGDELKMAILEFEKKGVPYV